MAIKVGVLSDVDSLALTFPASTAVSIGDLLWNNAGAAAKASAQTDQLSEVANQRLFASLFLGVSAVARLVTETEAQSRTIRTDTIVDATCTSTTWALGDLVGPTEDTGGTFLENQQVKKVVDSSLAIGYCVKAGTSLTTVRCRLLSRYLPSTIRSPFFGYQTGQGGAVTQITSSATGVTLSKQTGQITTVALTTAGAAEERFTVTNTLVEATDCIALGTTYAGAGTPAVSVMAVSAGSFDLVITNLHVSAALNAVMVINFALIKGKAA